MPFLIEHRVIMGNSLGISHHVLSLGFKLVRCYGFLAYLYFVPELVILYLLPALDNHSKTNNQGPGYFGQATRQRFPVGVPYVQNP
jgi:ABC-type uncharacterized transport system permease subunit